MKLVVVTETYPPEVNGVAMTWGHLVSHMVQRGHHVTVVRPRQTHDGKAPATAPPSSGEQAVGLLHEYPVPGLPLPRYEGLRFGLPVRGRLKRLLRTMQPNLVHIATEGPLGFAALSAARSLGIPLTSSFHTNFHEYGKHYGYGLLTKPVLGYLRRVHNRTTCTMVPSQTIQQELIDAGFHNVILLERGVDTQLFTPSRRSEDMRKSWGVDGGRVAVYVGRIANEKNIPLVVKAFEAIREADPAWKLVLVGDGPARASLAAKHQDYIFAGMQRGEALATHYASGDLFLFGSVTETFGNVVTEAMASGLPVVAYDYAAPAKFIKDNTNGLLARFDDEQHFIQRARDAVAKPHDELAAIGQAACQTMQGVSWDAVVDVFETALHEAHAGGDET